MTVTAAELAALLKGVLEGDGSRRIADVATLENAGPESISWLTGPELLPRLEKSQAGVVLAPPECPVPEDRTVIRVSDPDLALCDVLRRLAPPMELIPPGVHPTAVVGPEADVTGAAIGAQVCVGARTRIGAGTQLHPGVRIGADVRMGRDCVLWPNVVVRERVVIGDRVIIHPNSTIGADGFGYHQRGGQHVKIPQIGTVIIEDDVEIGANSAIDRARSGATRIGRGTKIDNLVQIGHNVVLDEGCLIVAQCGISGSTTLGHHVVLAGQVGLIDHLRIGNQVVLAAQSGVTGHIPDGKVYRGTPAVENMEYCRQQVVARRLPKLAEQLRELARRVERLESAENDRA
ncbi:MAG: UDP-3-O-(3-hydroxymyristoyl)glucosamine N-acyltransferase [Phycisphaerae bacterium]